MGSADELLFREALGSQYRQHLGELLGDAELLVVDEAQRVSNIGLNLKIEEYGGKLFGYEFKWGVEGSKHSQ